MRRSTLPLLVLPVVGALAVPVTAGASAAIVKGKPAVAITGSPAVYSKGAVTFKVGTGTCSTTNYSFSITNRTKVAEQVTVSGQPAGPPLAPKATQYECVGLGTVAFGLAGNPSAELLATGRK